MRAQKKWRFGHLAPSYSRQAGDGMGYDSRQGESGQCVGRRGRAISDKGATVEANQQGFLSIRIAEKRLGERSMPRASITLDVHHPDFFCISSKERDRKYVRHSSVGVSVLYTQGGRYALTAPRVWAGDL